jgi:L-lactate dehydrogenase complex protein LldG
VRAGVGKDDFARRRAAADAYMAAKARGPQPALADDLAARFQAKAEYLASSVERVSSSAAVPGAVARYLAANELGAEAVATPDVAGLDWAAAGLMSPDVLRSTPIKWAFPAASAPLLKPAH